MVSPQVLGSDIEYPLQSNALSAKSILGGRVALTGHWYQVGMPFWLAVVHHLAFTFCPWLLLLLRAAVAYSEAH